MSLGIGRLGWLGVALEPSYNTPTNPTDYVPFTANTLEGIVNNDDITSAFAVREKIASSVATKFYSKGDVEMNLDPKIAGYFLVSALGQPTVTNLGSGVFKHYMTRAAGNTPWSLSLNSNRVTDQVLFTGSAVDQLEIDVKDSFATLKASVIGQFPVTSTSGAVTTASGTNFTYKGAQFAFGTTVSGAASSNLKLSEFKLTIKNNVEPVFRHGSGNPASVNSKEFEVSGDYTLYFENATQRNAYYNANKQSGQLSFTGASLPGGQSEQIIFNFYQLRVDTWALETGLANFFAEKGKLVAEYNTALGLSIDATVVNQKSLYI